MMHLIESVGTEVTEQYSRPFCKRFNVLRNFGFTRPGNELSIAYNAREWSLRRAQACDL